jgi:hypothetical protein
LLVDDAQKQTRIAITRVGTPPSIGDNGSYEFQTVGIAHWAEHDADNDTYRRPGWFGSPAADEDEFIVDKSPTLRNAVLQWLETESWILPSDWKPPQ